MSTGTGLSGFDSTYEGLKPEEEAMQEKGGQWCFDSTYEGLKRLAGVDLAVLGAVFRQYL